MRESRNTTRSTTFRWMERTKARCMHTNQSSISCFIWWISIGTYIIRLIDHLIFYQLCPTLSSAGVCVHPIKIPVAIQPIYFYIHIKNLQMLDFPNTWLALFHTHVAFQIFVKKFKYTMKHFLEWYNFLKLCIFTLYNFCFVNITNIFLKTMNIFEM